MKLILTVGVPALFVLMSAVACLAAESDPDPAKPRLDIETLRSLRTQAAHRPRRMIFNNDGDDVIYTKKEPTREALLALRTSPLVGSQVDSIFYSNSLCFGDALHNSEVMTPFTNTEGIFANNGLPQLMERGIDAIEVMVEFCHANDIEIFWDMRMNDTHDAMIGGYGPPLRPKLKLDNPDYIVGAADKMPPHGTWTSVDYAVPEIRELCYRFFEEVCRKFDVDGVEMDFFRHACFFKTVAWGGAATQDELDMMTDLMRRIRAMTEREGMRRGRPILVAMRVPDSVEYSRGIGLDIETWLSEGLVDILVGTGYFQLNEWEYLVDLGHRHGVPVYPCLSDSRVQGQDRFRRASMESYRARAAMAWAAGGDGIYLFNYFNPRGPVWRELGDPEALRSKDKLYFVTVRDGVPSRYLAGGNEMRNLPILTPTHPRLLPPGESVELEMRIADDMGWAEENGLTPTVTCHAQTLGAAGAELSVNDELLGAPTVAGRWLDYDVPARLIKPGANRFALRVPPQDENKLDKAKWSVEYEAGDMPGEPWRKFGFGDGCVAEIVDGKLLIADRSTEGGSYAFYYYPCSVAPDETVVVELRLKQLTGWSSIMMENGVNAAEVQFFPDHLAVRGGGPSYSMNTADDFHTYRFEFGNKNLLVYVDGELCIDETGKFTRPGYDGRSGVMFGAANSGSVGEALWESVKVRNQAVTLLDLALSIRYGDE